MSKKENGRRERRKVSLFESLLFDTIAISGLGKGRQRERKKKGRKRLRRSAYPKKSGAKLYQRLRVPIQSGPAERPMRTDYNCKRSLVGEVSEEAPPDSLGDSRHWHEYTRATTCQRISRERRADVHREKYQADHLVAPTKPVPAPEPLPPALSRSEYAPNMRPADYPAEKEPFSKPSTDGLKDGARTHVGTLLCSNLFLDFSLDQGFPTSQSLSCNWLVSGDFSFRRMNSYYYLSLSLCLPFFLLFFFYITRKCDT